MFYCFDSKIRNFECFNGYITISPTKKKCTLASFSEHPLSRPFLVAVGTLRNYLFIFITISCRYCYYICWYTNLLSVIIMSSKMCLKNPCKVNLFVTARTFLQITLERYILFDIYIFSFFILHFNFLLCISGCVQRKFTSHCLILFATGESQNGTEKERCCGTGTVTSKNATLEDHS